MQASILLLLCFICFTKGVVLLLMLEIQVDNRTATNRDLTAGPQVKSAAWCVVLRMLDVVESFSLKGEWRGDLIDKWREAFQLLEAVSGLPLQVSKHHPGSCLCICTLDTASVSHTILLCQVTLIQLMS